MDRYVALVRQAIFHVLDGREWDFTDDEQRVDFADQVVAWLPNAAPQATDQPGSGGVCKEADTQTPAPAVAAPIGFADAVKAHGDNWHFGFPFDDKTKTYKGVSAATMCALGEHTSDFEDCRHMLMCTKHGRLFQVD